MNDTIAVLITTLMMSVLTIAVVFLVLRHRRDVRGLLSRERLAALEKGSRSPGSWTRPAPGRPPGCSSRPPSCWVARAWA